MDMPIDAHDIAYAENFLASDDIATALPLLEKLAQMAKEYADAECVATDKKQWFSFADAFERLAYRRVERDPRELEQLEVPFDRLYADLAFAYIRQREYVKAKDALMQAVRWNPMKCNYRLDLAELFRALGDVREWSALSVSVIERASEPVSLGRAHANLGAFFLDSFEEPNLFASAACSRIASRLSRDDARTQKLAARLDEEHPELAAEPDRTLNAELELQGIPTQASAEIAICLLMCASDAAAAGDRAQAAKLTVRARDLIGTDACESLIKLIHESDSELAAERAQGEGEPAGGAGAAGAADVAAPGEE